MLGETTTCSICGQIGIIFGCPSYNDVCIDAEFCRKRAIFVRDREIRELKLQIENYKKQNECKTSNKN